MEKYPQSIVYYFPIFPMINFSGRKEHFCNRRLNTNILDHFQCDPLITKEQIGTTSLSFTCKKLLQIAKFKSFYIEMIWFAQPKKLINRIKDPHSNLGHAAAERSRCWTWVGAIWSQPTFSFTLSVQSFTFLSCRI